MRVEKQNPPPKDQNHMVLCVFCAWYCANPRAV